MKQSSLIDILKYGIRANSRKDIEAITLTQADYEKLKNETRDIAVFPDDTGRSEFMGVPIEIVAVDNGSYFRMRGKRP